MLTKEYSFKHQPRLNRLQNKAEWFRVCLMTFLFLWEKNMIKFLKNFGVYLIEFAFLVMLFGFAYFY